VTGSTAGSRKKTTTAGRQTTERVLFIAEGLCIGLTAVSHTAAVIHSSTRKPVSKSVLHSDPLPILQLDSAAQGVGRHRRVIFMTRRISIKEFWRLEMTDWMMLCLLA
jgi:hypothetical protein